MRPLSGGSYAVAMFSENTSATTVTASLASLGIPAGTYTVRDVVNLKNLPPTSSSLTMTPAGHGIVMVKLTPQS